MQEVAEPSTNGRILLVVDDDTANLDAVSSFLECAVPSGCRVLTASCPKEAKEMLVREGGRLWKVLSDIDMPGGSGLNLCREIRERHPDVALAIMTGAPDPNREAAARELDAKWFLKPFKLNDVRAWARQSGLDS